MCVYKCVNHCTATRKAADGSCGGHFARRAAAARWGLSPALSYSDGEGRRRIEKMSASGAATDETVSDCDANWSATLLPECGQRLTRGNETMPYIKVVPLATDALCGAVDDASVDGAFAMKKGAHRGPS